MVFFCGAGSGASLVCDKGAEWAKNRFFCPQVFMMALMIYTLIERQMRRELSQSDQTIKGNHNTDTPRPTTAVVFKHFEAIGRVEGEDNRELRAFIEGLMPVHESILGLLGLTTKVYSLSAKILTLPLGAAAHGRATMTELTVATSEPKDRTVKGNILLPMNSMLLLLPR